MPAHANDSLLPAIEPTGNSFGDAVEALGTASNAIRQRQGYDTPSGWPGIVALTNGRLLPAAGPEQIYFDAPTTTLTTPSINIKHPLPSPHNVSPRSG